jgi:hypothetical protein
MFDPSFAKAARSRMLSRLGHHDAALTIDAVGKSTYISRFVGLLLCFIFGRATATIVSAPL